MSLSTFEFDGITKPYLVLERSWSLPGWAPIEREYATVPGRAGGVQTEMRTGIRRFPLPIIIRSKSAVEKKLFIEDMRSWLIHEEARTLVFSKYPNRTLFAQIEGSPDFEQIWNFGQGVLNIVCSDPYEYGDSNINAFSNGEAIAYNGGNVNAPPLFEIDVLDDITHLDIIANNSYMRLGRPAQIGSTVYDWKRLVLHDTMKTLLPWSDAVNVDNGYVAGTMAATQAGFRAELFGEAIEPEAWQGPSKRRSLPEPVLNFQIDVLIEFLNFTKETGMIEIYLLDAFSNTVAKIGFEDVWPTVKRSQAKFQLGNVDEREIEHHVSAENWSAWNDFTGLIRLVRRDNVYVPYIAYIGSDGQHKYRYVSYSYTDSQATHGAQVTQIKVAIRKWPGSSTSQADMTIKDIKVWEFDDQPEGVPVMAKAEDKIIIDAKEGNVLLNGEVQEDLADWFGDFFDLPPGKTPLVIQPADKLNAKVIVRERFG